MKGLKLFVARFYTRWVIRVAPWLLHTWTGHQWFNKALDYRMRHEA